MFEPATTGIAIALAFIPLPSWGLWPTLRTRCGAAVPAFAALNMMAQLFMATLWGLTMGMVGSTGGTFTSALHDLFFGAFDIHAVAVILGGFALGHADHLGAFAMQYIPAGVAYPMYSGTTLVTGSILNYVQVQPAHPVLWMCGLLLVLTGVILLGVMQSVDDRCDDEKAFSSSFVSQSTTPGGRDRAGSARSVVSQQTLLSDGFEPLEDIKLPGVALPGPVSISPKFAMLICLTAGLCGTAWSPLSTFARKGDSEGAVLMSNPYVCIFFFNVGQSLSYPSVAAISGWLGGTGTLEPLKELTWPAVGWGLLCGATVSCGYMGYFVGSSKAAPTVCFAISACNPLLALILDVFAVGAFTTASMKVKVILGCCIVAYSSAIGLLVLSG